MSKLNIVEAFRAEGIKCEFEGKPGKVVLITEEIAERFAIAEDSRSPEVEVGEAIVSYREGDRVRGRVILPTADNDLNIVLRDVDGEEIFLGAGSLNDLLQTERENISEDNLSERSARDLETLQEFTSIVFQQVLDDKFIDMNTKSTALSYQLTTSRNFDAEYADEGLDDEQFDRIAEQRALREAIGRVNPDHPDALVLEDEAGYQSERLANDVIGSIALNHVGFNSAQMNALRGDERLSKEVFGVMTETPISQLSANMLSPADFEKIRQELRPGQIKGGFKSEITTRLDEIFDERMPGYHADIDLYTKDGADILLVRDHVGHYAYGWDTDSRLIVMPETFLVVLGEADVPSEEELQRLRDIVADLRYEHGDEMFFDMFDGQDDRADEVDDFFTEIVGSMTEIQDDDPENDEWEGEDFNY